MCSIYYTLHIIAKADLGKFHQILWNSFVIHLLWVFLRHPRALPAAAEEPEEQAEKSTHTEKPDLPSPLVSAGQAWLAELDGDKVPDVDIRILLLCANNLGIALDDAQALEEKFLSYRRVVTVSPNGLGKYLLLPHGDWAGEGKQMAGGGDQILPPCYRFPWRMTTRRISPFRPPTATLPSVGCRARE
jgi:hypothetical protein